MFKNGKNNSLGNECTLEQAERRKIFAEQTHLRAWRGVKGMKKILKMRKDINNGLKGNWEKWLILNGFSVAPYA